jgi:hypothetical protein
MRAGHCPCPNTPRGPRILTMPVLHACMLSDAFYPVHSITMHLFRQFTSVSAANNGCEQKKVV